MRFRMRCYCIILLPKLYFYTFKIVDSSYVLSNFPSPKKTSITFLLFSVVAQRNLAKKGASVNRVIKQDAQQCCHTYQGTLNIFYTRQNYTRGILSKDMGQINENIWARLISLWLRLSTATFNAAPDVGPDTSFILFTLT